ncbi:MAG: transposase [Candidatus Nitrosoglobus sp.]
MAHTNGIESVWIVLKRGFYGVYYQFKHLQRHVGEFAYRLSEGSYAIHTLDRISALIRKSFSIRLAYTNLTGSLA